MSTEICPCVRLRLERHASVVQKRVYFYVTAGCCWTTKFNEKSMFLHLASASAHERPDFGVYALAIFYYFFLSCLATMRKVCFSAFSLAKGGGGNEKYDAPP